MPIKELNDDVIIVETLKKATIIDLLHFDKDGKDLFQVMGLKQNITHIADALTKLISTNIKAYLLQYLEELYELECIKTDGDADGNEKDNN